MKKPRSAYGITLNIHPGRVSKRVVLHGLNCPAYHQQQPSSRNLYTFKQNRGCFADAVAKASEWALEWHAPVKLCGLCVNAGRLLG